MVPNRRHMLFAALVVGIAAVTGAAALLLTGPKPAGIGTALIGGPFALTDQDGKRVSEKDFLGRHMLVIFGYTFCPDVCPGELQVMSAALDIMGADSRALTPVFVSFDPERDPPPVMKVYIGNFHPAFRALTGSPQDIAAMARTYRIYYSKVPSKGGPDQYLMDHSAFIYLMGPDGAYKTHFTYGTDARKLAAEITAAMAE